MKGKTARPKILQGAPAGYNDAAIVIYETPDGVRLDVKLEKETIWLNLNQMTILFDRDKSVISCHLRNVFKEKELDQGSTVAFFATVQNEGGRKVERRVDIFYRYFWLPHFSPIHSHKWRDSPPPP